MKKIYKIKKFRRINSGFTLVETMVAISIFSMSLLGILSVLASGITNTTYAKEKMVADYLAQEGIEYIRNLRDTFVLYGGSSSQDGWNSFNTKVAGASGNTVCASGNGCYFDGSNFTNPITAMNNIAACAQAKCADHQLLYDSSNGKYDYAFPARPRIPASPGRSRLV